MELKVLQHRQGLSRTLKAIDKGTVTIGFIGGSITDPTDGDRWPEYVIGWFNCMYPRLRVNAENAAIGATGSELAAFRAQRDLIQPNCDIVFVEFAVNDNWVPSERRSRSREGLIRKLLADEERDVVLVYTFCQDMYGEMFQGNMPATIREFEEIGRHYGIGSVWMGLHALEEVKRGCMRWEEWLPDGLHPSYRGSLCYAQSVIGYLEKELLTEPNSMGIPFGSKLPVPLDGMNWEKTVRIPFEDVTLEGPWAIRRWSKLAMNDRILDTAAVGAKLFFQFSGRGLALGFDFGWYSSEFRYRIDGKEWVDVVRDRPEWCPNTGWFRLEVISDNLEDGSHEFELEVTHGNRDGCKGTNFRLALIGVLQ